MRLTATELKNLLYITDKNTKERTYLVPGVDFEVVKYADNVKAGTASVTLRGLGKYGGSRVVKYKIKSAKRSIVDIILGK